MNQSSQKQPSQTYLVLIPVAILICFVSFFVFHRLQNPQVEVTAFETHGDQLSVTVHYENRASEGVVFSYDIVDVLRASKGSLGTGVYYHVKDVALGPLEQKTETKSFSLPQGRKAKNLTTLDVIVTAESQH